MPQVGTAGPVILFLDVLASCITPYRRPTEDLTMCSTGLLVGKAAATLNHLNELVRGSEVDLPGERCSEIGFQEVTVPSLPELK